MTSRHRSLWWQSGVLYEVYPRSFGDASGDGVGDLAGITERLDYLEWLGVNAIWIAPFYPSPMADFGYDVADHTNVDPLFGSLDDFDVLLAEAHRRAIRVVVDYVPNHTSDRHPWFTDSRSSRDSPKRDWYVWRDAAPGSGPPNNWISMFGGSAWEWDEATSQYYLHSFLKQQPDINWREPAARQAMLGVLRFWLERGVDGFRIDVAQFVAKDPQLRDNPPNPHPERLAHLGEWRHQLHLYDHGHPDMHDIYREIRRLVDGYPGKRVTIGELHHPEFDVWARSYGQDLDEIHLPFNFHLLRADWNAASVRAVVDGISAALPAGAWANWVLGNHDQPRIASRVGQGQARVAMMLLLTLRGAPTLYYGDEIGMENATIPVDRLRDPWGITEPAQSRDPERTPMQWNGSANAGFCPPGVEPWLPLASDWQTRNVAAQRDDPSSLLGLTRRLLELRRTIPALIEGTYAPVDSAEGVFAYTRRLPDEPTLLVALNFTDEPRPLTLATDGRVVFSTDPHREQGLVRSPLRLAPSEGLLLELVDTA
ncbi:MAG TPA: alpha-amylase family glycosyl hydrolase [Candidatus Limnocylindrales bacterium]|nr:alpha-amylase family glycosyl hydrolase [Candidatus Limnocylindrales bacterium]